MPSSSGTARSRLRILALALLLFAGVFALRTLFESPQSGVAMLYVIPVVLVGIEFGGRAGAIAGLVAVALTALWSELHGVRPPLASYLPRGAGFIVVGAVTGYMAERLRGAAGAAEAGARHFALSRDLLCTADFAGNLVTANGSWQRVLGWSPEELIGRPFADLVHPDDRESTRRETEQLLAGNATIDFTNRYRTRTNTWRWLEWSSKVDHEHELIYAVARDVTDRRLAEQAGEEARLRFRRVFDDSVTGMAVVSLDGGIIEANESLARILGTTRGELIGRQSLVEFAGPEDAPMLQAGIERLLDETSDVLREELRVYRADGKRVWADLTISIVRDSSGRPLYRLSQLLEIEARKVAEDRLRHLADHDPLSGLVNRRRFEEELARELGHGAQDDRRSAVLVIDVDDFKSINDSLGHAAGDVVIANLGQQLRDRLRTTDVASRLGGDEFAVLLRRSDHEEALEVAQSIREAAAPIALSIGVAVLRGSEAQSPGEVMHAADEAMYDAKRQGKDRVVSSEELLVVDADGESR